ncbi:MAG: ribonuclease P protein component [Firmicutes bacterium]|nr:ribonuclease P protein component [Bacillota bacterium]
MQKKYRLKKNKDYQKLYKTGKSFACKYLILHYAPLKDKTALSIGFSVSGKLGKAVKRNKLRRQIKEATRHLLSNIPRGYNLIITARTTAAGIPYKTISDSIKYMLKKTNLWLG